MDDCNFPKPILDDSLEWDIVIQDLITTDSYNISDESSGY